MGLLCNIGRNCNCNSNTNNGCTNNCNTNCRCVCGEVAAETTPEPMQVRAILDYVLDSCCTTEDVCREIIIDCPHIFDPDDLEIGQAVEVEIPDDIVFKEVSRQMENCACLSTVRFAIPIRIYGNRGHGCVCKYIDREICVIRSANLCCALDSELQANNTKALNISAVVSEIHCNEITICLCILFRSCLQQVVMREFTWEATPVCVSQDCVPRTSLIDPCDVVCGCVAGKTCPTC